MATRTTARATRRSTTTIETAIGPCRLSWTERGLTEVKLLRDPARAPAGDPPPAWVRDAADLIARHLAGAPQDLSAIPLDDEGLPPFHRKLYEASRRVAPGRTVTYAELAALAGSPGAARAAGQAMARNPWLLVVPCHRVLATGGTGGFSAPGGLSTKARMLALEGVPLDPPAAQMRLLES